MMEIPNRYTVDFNGVTKAFNTPEDAADYIERIEIKYGEINLFVWDTYVGRQVWEADSHAFTAYTKEYEDMCWRYR